MVMAKHMGETITLETAKEMMRELFLDSSYPPERFGTGMFEGYRFQAEKFLDALPELHPLHEQHWEETEGARHGLQLNPDYDRLVDAERAGSLLQFTARYDGKLVGNIRMYLFNDTHTQTLAAKEDTFFLLPEARKGLVALKFWKFMEEAVRLLGVREIRTDSKVLYDDTGKLTRDVGKLNKYLGYSHVSNGYFKRLEPIDG